MKGTLPAQSAVAVFKCDAEMSDWMAGRLSRQSLDVARTASNRLLFFCSSAKDKMPGCAWLGRAGQRQAGVGVGLGGRA